MSYLSMFETGNQQPLWEIEAIRNEVISETIDEVNRLFDRETLDQPSEADRIQIEKTIFHQLRESFRRRDSILPQEIEEELTSQLAHRLLGLGFLDALLPPMRTDISEIAIYSSGLLQIMAKGNIRWKTLPIDPSPEEIERVLDRLLSTQNKTLNETNPSINARLPRTEHNPGGGRIKALHPSITPPGRNASVNIRLYEQKPVLPEWIIQKEMASPEQMEVLKRAIQEGKRILITGGTRTGKTTLLSALCNFLPANWRIVKIEDPEEIWIDRSTVQTIEARPAAIGTELLPYTLANGVDDAMRMSPDYLVIGEVRDGHAALALFRAMMTGHSGACTFHADSPQEAIVRLANIMGTDAGVHESEANRMIKHAIDLIVQINIVNEIRKITSIIDIQTTVLNSTH